MLENANATDDGQALLTSVAPGSPFIDQNEASLQLFCQENRAQFAGSQSYGYNRGRNASGIFDWSHFDPIGLSGLGISRKSRAGNVGQDDKGNESETTS